MYLSSKALTALSSSLKKSPTFFIPSPVETLDKQSDLACCKAGQSISVNSTLAAILDFSDVLFLFPAILIFTQHPPRSPEDPFEGWFGHSVFCCAFVMLIYGVHPLYNFVNLKLEIVEVSRLLIRIHCISLIVPRTCL